MSQREYGYKYSNEQDAEEYESTVDIRELNHQERSEKLEDLIIEFNARDFPDIKARRDAAQVEAAELLRPMREQIETGEVRYNAGGVISVYGLDDKLPALAHPLWRHTSLNEFPKAKERIDDLLDSAARYVEGAMPYEDHREPAESLDKYRSLSFGEFRALAQDDNAYRVLRKKTEAEWAPVDASIAELEREGAPNPEGIREAGNALRRYLVQEYYNLWRPVDRTHDAEEQEKQYQAINDHLYGVSSGFAQVLLEKRGFIITEGYQPPTPPEPVDKTHKPESHEEWRWMEDDLFFNQIACCNYIGKAVSSTSEEHWSKDTVSQACRAALEGALSGMLGATEEIRHELNIGRGADDLSATLDEIVSMMDPVLKERVRRTASAAEYFLQPRGEQKSSAS